MVNGDTALDVRTFQNLFARFKTGGFDLNDKDCSGRPIEANSSLFEEHVEKYRKITLNSKSESLFYKYLSICLYTRYICMHN